MLLLLFLIRWLLSPSEEDVAEEIHDASTLVVLLASVLLLLVDVYVLIVLLHLCHYGFLHGYHLLLRHPLALLYQASAAAHHHLLLMHPLWLLQLVDHLLKLSLRRRILLLLLLLILLSPHEQLIRVDRGDVICEIGSSQAAIPGKVAERDGGQGGELGQEEVSLQGSLV